VLNVIWDKLLPALQPKRLKANTAAAEQLKEKLAHLEVQTAQGSATSPLADKALNRKFVFPASEQQIESVTLTSEAAGTLTVALRVAGQESQTHCGHLEWKQGRSPVMGSRLAQMPDELTAGSFAWQSNDTCVIKLCAYETPFHTTFTLKFAGDQLTLDSEAYVAFGPTKRPQLIGRAE
jgi:hypothetical protein